MEKTINTERINARLSKDLKDKIEVASSITGLKMTRFILRSAEEAANKVISESQKVLSTKEDRALFLELVTRPPKGNQELKKAFEEHNKSLEDWGIEYAF